MSQLHHGMYLRSSIPKDAMMHVLFGAWADGGRIALQNAGTSPIYDLVMTAVSSGGSNNPKDISVAMLRVQEENCLFEESGRATRCRDERIKVSIVPPDLHHGRKPEADAGQDRNARYELRFRDAANRCWLRDGDGVLHRVGRFSSLADYREDSMPLRASMLDD